jgi:hypothetical protein
MCQQNKNLTHKTQVPQYKINTPMTAQPFSQVALDLIPGLPKSQEYDTILTIVDHRCSRAAVFLPYHITITGLNIAKLYYQHIY